MASVCRGMAVAQAYREEYTSGMVIDIVIYYFISDITTYTTKNKSLPL